MLVMDHIEAPVLAGLRLGVYPSVVVAGAYKGDTVAFIREHHEDARILAAEPQYWAFMYLVERFSRCKDIILLPEALGAVNEVTNGFLYKFNTDACSLLPYNDDDTPPDGCIVTPVIARLREHGFGYVDLFHMNMEGYEYTLLPWMLRSENIYIRRYMIQFHHTQTMELNYKECVALLYNRGYRLTPIGKGWELWQK